MKHFLRAVPLVLASALMVPAFVPTVAAAQSVDEQQQVVDGIVDELERLEERALALGEQYVEAVDAKATLDEEIIASEARVAEKEAEIETLRGNLAEMAIRSFVGSGTTPLGPLFEDTDDLNSDMQRDELARVALSAGTVTTDDLDAVVKELEEERSELDRKRSEAAQLEKSLQESQVETDRLTGEYTQARADAEAKLGVLIAEEEARRARESALRLQREFEAAQAAAAASNNSSNNNATTSSNNSGGNNNASNTNTASTNSGNGDGGNSSSTPAPAAAPTPAPSAPAVSSRAGTAVNAAYGQLGVPYKYATSKPGVSFDCSGLTGYAWAQAGVYLPHQSRAQFGTTPRVAPAQAQPGDLIFFYSPISHVSIYIGNGQQIHAPNTGSFVKVGNVNWSKVTGVGRPG